MPSMGASTGIAGLFGALGVVLFGMRSKLPARTSSLRRRWLTVLAIQVGLEVLLESPFSPLPGVRIDHAGHLGGFLGGGLATVLSLGTGNEDTRPRRGRWLLPGALVALVAASFAVAGQRVWDDDRDSLLKVLQHLRGETLPPDTQNLYAWEVALDPHAERPLVRAAEILAAQAVVNHRDKVTIHDTPKAVAAWWIQQAAIADTHATLLFRLGKVEQAIEVEHAALQAPITLPTDLTTSMNAQLARFVVVFEEHRRGRPESSGASAGAPQPMVHWEGTRLQLTGVSHGPFTLLAPVRDPRGTLLGLLSLQLPAGTPVPRGIPLGGPEGKRSVSEGWWRQDTPQASSRRLVAHWSPMDDTVADYPGVLPP